MPPLKDDSIAYSGISNNNPAISGSTKEITIDTENKELDRLHSQYSIVVEKIIESIINCSPNAIASEKEKLKYLLDTAFSSFTENSENN